MLIDLIFKTTLKAIIYEITNNKKPELSTQVNI